MKKFEEYNEKILKIKNLLNKIWLNADKLSDKDLVMLKEVEKRFNKLNEEEDWFDIEIKKETKETKETKIEVSEDTAIAYVDGSFDSVRGLFGSGVVFVKDNEAIEEISFSGLDEHNQWNICGECEASIRAIEVAINRGYKKLIMYYDYQGIGSWAERKWKAKNVYTQGYIARFDKLKEKIEIEFVKVKGHSDDKWNDVADRLAKQSLGK